ncbi:MAG: hypothetical protein II387_01275, partial [Oscillospiraceae bacterium]|nr:hypothetical protein [Oscillospiraceae bacterium]
VKMIIPYSAVKNNKKPLLPWQTKEVSLMAEEERFGFDPIASICLFSERRKSGRDQNTGSSKAQHRCPLDGLRISAIQRRDSVFAHWLSLLAFHAAQLRP